MSELLTPKSTEPNDQNPKLISREQNLELINAFEPIARRNPNFVYPHTLPEGDPKRNIIALIKYAHLDPWWLWDERRAKSRAVHTTRAALNNRENNADFSHTQDNAWFYHTLERTDKGMFNEVLEAIDGGEGSWEAAGGGWIEPDNNLTRASSLSEQYRAGNRYFVEHMGILPKVAMSVDSFGHTNNLVKPLKAAGYDFFTHLRPQADALRLPNGPYLLTAEDNSYQILAERIFEEYGSGKNTTRGHLKVAADALHEPLSMMMVFIGIVNHGGGANQEILDIVKGMHDDEALPQFVHTTINEYVNVVRSSDYKPPIHVGEMQAHARGCYSVNGEIKSQSRRAENLHETMRPYTVLAHHTAGFVYPVGESKAPIRKMLMGQMHDVLPGSLIGRGLNRIRDQQGTGAEFFQDQTDNALIAYDQTVHIADFDDARTKVYIAHNHHPFPVYDLVVFEENQMVDGIQITDAQGQVIPHQLVEPDGVLAMGTTPRKKVAVIASIPPGGHTVLRADTGIENLSKPEAMDASNMHIDNGRMRIRFDEQTKQLIELYDHELDYDFLGKDANGNVLPAFLPVVCDDTVMGETVDVYAHRKQTWVPNEVDSANPYDVDMHGNRKKLPESMGLKSLELIETGPVRSTIRATYQYRDPNRLDEDPDSVLKVDFLTLANSNRFDINVEFTNFEKHKLFKFLTGVNLGSRQVTAGQSNGTVVRDDEDGNEWPSVGWVHVSGRRKDKHSYAGITFHNDGSGSYSIANEMFGQTFLRTADDGQHAPLRRINKLHAHTDQGIHKMRFGITTHDGQLNPGSVERTSLVFNQPPEMMLATINPSGTQGSEVSHYSTDLDNFNLISLKLAEDGSGDTILEGCEINGWQTKGTFNYFGQEIPLDLHPGEYIVLRIKSDGEVVKTNINELEEIIIYNGK